MFTAEKVSAAPSQNLESAKEPDLHRRVRQGYRPDIDGLRAIAVLGVLLFHADVGLTGGFTGVDVFFVISGYLITDLILKDLRSNQFSLLNFWERRIRRILPAQACVISVTIALCWFRLLPHDFYELGQSVVAQTALVSNYFFYTVSGYFEIDMALKPLMHTWSLAVEEQFYLLFPFAAVLGFRKSPAIFQILIAALGSLSFALCIQWSKSHAWANFFFLPTRAWELLMGAFLAATPIAKLIKSPWNEALGIIGLVSIAVAMFSFGPETPMPGLAAFLPCGGAALIIVSGASSAIPYSSRLLAVRPLMFVGLISYSLYLWHWPLLAFAKYWTTEPLPLIERGGILVISAALASLTWHFVETPFRQRRLLPHRKQMLAFAGFTGAILFFIGLAMVKTDGFPSRVPRAVRDFAAGAMDKPSLAPAIGHSLADVQSGRLTELGVNDPSIPISLLVWGDRHALAILPVIDSLCNAHGTRGIAVAHAATPPLVGFDNPRPDGLQKECVPFNSAVVKFIQEHKPRNVLLVASWDGYFKGTDPKVLKTALRETFNEVIAANSRVWVLLTVPVYEWPVPKRLAQAALFHQSIDTLGLSLDEYSRVNQLQSATFSEASPSAPISFLNPISFFAGPEGHCRIEFGGRSLYYDNHHLSVHGSMQLSPVFEPVFSAAE